MAIQKIEEDQPGQNQFLPSGILRNTVLPDVPLLGWIGIPYRASGRLRSSAKRDIEQ